jgi:hypothetical protein
MGANYLFILVFLLLVPIVDFIFPLFGVNKFEYILYGVGWEGFVYESFILNPLTLGTALQQLKVLDGI